MSKVGLLLTAAGGAPAAGARIWLKPHAFVALLVASFLVALIAGIPLADIVPTITTGTGDTLGFVAIIVGLGGGDRPDHPGGATALSHVNDSGFWLFNRFLALSEADTLRSWTVMETLLGVTGFAVALVVSLFL